MRIRCFEFSEPFYQTQRGISSGVLQAPQTRRGFKELKEAGFESGLLEERKE